MRYKNEMKLGDAIRAYLKAMGLDRKLKEWQLIHSWEEVLGKTVAASTTDLKIYKQVLFVNLNSSIVRHQLQMMKTSLIDALNRRVGEEVIVNIVFK